MTARIDRLPWRRTSHVSRGGAMTARRRTFLAGVTLALAAGLYRYSRRGGHRCRCRPGWYGPRCRRCAGPGSGPPGRARRWAAGNRGGGAAGTAGCAAPGGAPPMWPPARASPAVRLDAGLASVSKAFSGAVALSLVADGKLSLGDTVGRVLPGLPRAWSKVTLRELLQHTSGVPDYTGTKAFIKALQKSLLGLRRGPFSPSLRRSSTSGRGQNISTRIPTTLSWA